MKSTSWATFLYQTMNKKSILQKAIALLAWTAVILQFYLIIVNRKMSIPWTILQFFSFFTILTNILTATCFTFLASKKNTRLKKLFSKPQTITAITVYILIVGAVYNLILRALWEPQGLQLIVDELLHSIVPVLAILYWFTFAPKKGLHWKDAFSWLLYPLIYIVFIFTRGAFMDVYPYPFIDVSTIGYPQAFTNAGVLVIIFWILSLLFIATAKALTKK